MYYDTIMAGFGGQGIQTISLLVATAAINKGMEVSYLPSYGVEKRGGRTNVIMVMADVEIGSPITNHPRCVIALDTIALNTYQEMVAPGGLLILNSSLVPENLVTRDDIEVIALRCNEEAVAIGSAKLANMIALGAFIKQIDFLNFQEIEGAMDTVIPERLKKHIPGNLQAIRRGMELAKESVSA
ncbi:MAG TPA: 2-oxoacid:acceptor oxidoreductase family protein [Spirochaetota bacterium]|nr:2-oxoacid:acceptor oxidoreductase family protein [Spirochaetota bacterium]